MLKLNTLAWLGDPYIQDEGQIDSNIQSVSTKRSQMHLTKVIHQNTQIRHQVKVQRSNQNRIEHVHYQVCPQKDQIMIVPMVLLIANQRKI